MNNSVKLTLLILAICLVFAISIILILACGPKPAKISINSPYDLTVNAKNCAAVLHWKINRRSDTPIGGYNIYLAKTADGDGDLYNSGPYPGDTDGDITRESIELSRLTNGRRYYAYVRTILNNGGLSEPSARVAFRPLAQGRFEISQNHTAKQSGYSFAKVKSTIARDFDNDFYIYAVKEKVGISSPSRLHSSLRKTLIKNESDAKSKFSQTQPLIKGNTYLLKTADGGNARLTLAKLISKEPNLKAIFDYIYYPPGVEP
jgi:hypothetical protein